ncbi:MAG TPA: hypothetical protein VFT88_05135 [Acidobacteriaceae bacterium]|jgi:hypothetical protein|nr:hypothetical protein [Acidobacteriaceae bacterium]
MSTIDISANGTQMAIEADFAQAASPIVYIEDGERYSTPFQVADARHEDSRAIEMVREWLESSPTLSRA